MVIHAVRESWQPDEYYYMRVMAIAPYFLKIALTHYSLLHVILYSNLKNHPTHKLHNFVTTRSKIPLHKCLKYNSSYHLLGIVRQGRFDIIN